MIKPHPESNLNNSILNIGSEIIKMLVSKKKKILIEEIISKLTSKGLKRDIGSIIDTITFLYIADIIKNDGYKIYLK